MSSINLLPKNFGLKENREKQKKTVIVCSIFLVLVSIISFGAVYIDKTIASKKSDFLDSKTEEINNKIKKEIKSSELFLETNKMEDIRELLDNHNYFTKAFNVIQNVISEDVYLTESKLMFDKERNLILEISGVANNYSAAINQIAIFKNSYWIEETKINSITSDESKASGNGKVNFSGTLRFKKDLISFREYYWDFSLALLSSKIDRYIKIDKYSAIFVDEESNGKDLIKVKFSGVAYDERKLVSFKDSLEATKVFSEDKRELILFKNNSETQKVYVKNVLISYDLNDRKNDKPIEFEGEMELELF